MGVQKKIYGIAVLEKRYIRARNPPFSSFVIFDDVCDKNNRILVFLRCANVQFYPLWKTKIFFRAQ